MNIMIFIEGETEKVFIPILREFLKERLPGSMPKIRQEVYCGRIPKENKLRNAVKYHCRNNDAVIALTDVYTGSGDFVDAADAKQKMRAWVGANPKFHPHAAQYDFEAWLLPYWDAIQKLAGHNRAAPSGLPETVNHDNPPARRLSEIFRLGKKRHYVKPRDAARILRNQDLSVAVEACPELKALVNTILKLCGADLL